jgi:hypothetical protein
VFLEGVQRRPHQAFNPVRPGRLDVQSPAAFQDLGVEMVGVLMVREDVLGNPGREGLAVLDGRLPEAEERADLGAVVLDGAAVPVVACPFPGRDVGLAGDVLDDDTGDILPLPGKTPLVVEELQ